MGPGGPGLAQLRRIIRPWLRPATPAMLGMAGVKPSTHVLDVAAGAGDQTLDIAERVGPDGYVLATDLSPEFFNSQRSRPPPRVIATSRRACREDGQNLQVEDIGSTRWSVGSA